MEGNSIGIFEAWSLWASGTRPEMLGDYLLWGYPLFGWGRLGKLLQALATSFVLVDILGEARLRQFGEALRRAISWADLSTFARSSVTLLLSAVLSLAVFLFEMVSAILAGPTGGRGNLEFPDPPAIRRNIQKASRDPSEGFLEEALKLHASSSLNWANLAISSLLGGLGAAYLPELAGWKATPLWGYPVLALLAGTLAYFVVSPILIFLLGIPLATIVALINLLALRPLGWVLRTPYLEKRALAASLILFLIGFHFELLLS